MAVHKDFREFVVNSWTSIVVYGCPMFIFVEKLRVFKRIIQVWNKNIFGIVHDRVVGAREELSKIQCYISIHGMNEENYSKEAAAKEKVYEAIRFQHCFWRDKAHVKWLTEGDRCTKFFHSYAKVKVAKCNLNCLMINDSLSTDLVTNANHVVGFYSNLYNSPHQPSDMLVFNSLGIKPSLVRAPKILPIIWSVPPYGWFKINTDGFSKGNPGQSACGGVIHMCHRVFLGCFAMPLGCRTAFFSELMVIILAIEIVSKKG
ncbi:hypothetical protein LWI29_003154 [Acer saccharum]|uniref:RNase H type-1 domain-containing protein n=1 Tax=Acer saccharum TaxID=4024 RepID=A0AA39W5G6_ACESA|nr:hypothetical protein LWI29_003154 [Acer saccharum]